MSKYLLKCGLTDRASLGARTSLIVLAILLTAAGVHADLDINAVAGVVEIDGEPASAGTSIMVRDLNTGATATTPVDGSSIPSFLKGQGRYDTGDVPGFNTGDTVVVSVSETGIKGEASAVLVAGTTTINLEARRERSPSIGNIPDQEGFEDVAWELDLDPYISDPDTPKSKLDVGVQSGYTEVKGHVITFLYPEGVLSETVRVYVRDGSSTVSRRIQVTVNPVNDPPRLAEISNITIMEGTNASLNLSGHVQDPDDQLEDFCWGVDEGDLVTAWMEGPVLTVVAPDSDYGHDSFQIWVLDSGNLSASQLVSVEVEANVTALKEAYEGQIESLRAEIENLEANNTNLASEIDSLWRELNTLEIRKTELQTQLKEKEDLVSTFQERIRRVESSDDEKAALIMELEHQRDNLTAEIDDLNKELDEVQSAHNQTRKELESTKSESQTRIQNLALILLQTRELLSQSRENITALVQMVADLSDKLDAKRAQLGSANLGIENLEAVIEALRENNRLLKEENLQMEASISQSSEDIISLELKNMRQLAEIERLRSIMATREINSSQVNPPLARMFSKAADFVKSGNEAINDGLRNELLLAIILLVAAASTITIVMRTSWMKMVDEDGFDRILRIMGRAIRVLGRLSTRIKKKQRSERELSETDRQYIWGLRRLGFDKEADEYLDSLPTEEEEP